jgi:glutathione S-transferase
MLTLFHAPMSRSSRILWLLEELGASQVEVVYVTIARQDGSGGADPKNPHPDAKVPALVHDGVLITESIAIAAYLCDLFPDAGLVPAIGDPQRGAVLSWLAYYAGVMEPVMTAGFAGLGDNPAMQRTFRGRAEVDRRILAALEKGPHILGDRFTAADVFVASAGHFMRQLLPAGATVDAFLAHVGSRPALARARARDAAPT